MFFDKDIFSSQLICKAFTSLFFGGWGSLIWFLRILGGVLVLFQDYFNLEKHVFILILFPFITRDTFFWGWFQQRWGGFLFFLGDFWIWERLFLFFVFCYKGQLWGWGRVLGGYGSFFGDFFLLWEGLFSCYAFIYFYFFFITRGTFPGVFF